MTLARATTLLALVTAALAIAGCGSGGSGDAVEDALGFMPKDSPVVVTLATDPDEGQWQQLDKLTKKLPFSGELKQRFTQGFEDNSKLDFDKDVKPILGNELVLVVPSLEELQQSDSAVLLALKVDDEDKAESFIKKDGTKISSHDGTDLYKESGDTYVALKEGVIVAADTEDDLKAALDRFDGNEGMTEDDLEARMAGLDGEALLKVGVNAKQVIAESPDREAKGALKVKWIAALRDVGTQIVARDDGIEYEFKTTSAGGLSPEDLPLSAGAEAAPVVRRATDVGFGMRDLAQTIEFGEMASRVTDPKGFAKYRKEKEKAGRQLGIDFDRDVFSQFEGDASVSVSIDGSFAMRSELRDPKAFQKTLRTAVPRLKRVAKDEYTGIAVPKKPGGFYAAATSEGKKYVFGVVGGKFVIATDAARASQFAAQSATPVPGAKGSVALAMDTRAIANEVARRQGQGAAALFTGAFGDLTGSIESETSGLTGRFKLGIK